MLTGRNTVQSMRSLTGEISSITIESSLWFTLFAFEGRIEALWEAVLKERVNNAGEMTDYSIQETNKAGSIHIYTPLACFLALWLAICGRM